MRDSECLAKQALCGRRAKADDHFWLRNGDLGFQPRATGKNFQLIRFLVNAAFAARLPLEMFHGVGDINFATVNTCGLERFVENASRGSYERLASKILFVAGLFADEHHASVLRAFAEDSLRARLPKVARFAGSGGHTQFG